MSRHVDRIVKRPHAVRRGHLQSSPRALHSITAHAQDQRTEQDDETRLRIADQRSLRDMHVQTNRLIEGVVKLRTSVSRVPTTIRNPHIDRPYTLSQLQNRVNKEVPGLASKAVEKIEHVQAHLADLQTEPYVEKKEGAAAMREFENQIKDWTTDKKREKLKNLEFEEEKRMVDLKTAAEELGKLLDDMKPNTTRSAAKQSEVYLPNAAKESNVKAVAYTPTVEKPSAAKPMDQPTTEEKQSVSATESKQQEPAEEISLTKLQKRLEANMKVK